MNFVRLQGCVDQRLLTGPPSSSSSAISQVKTHVIVASPARSSWRRRACFLPRWLAGGCCSIHGWAFPPSLLLANGEGSSSLLYSNYLTFEQASCCTRHLSPSYVYSLPIHTSPDPEPPTKALLLLLPPAHYAHRGCACETLHPRTQNQPQPTLLLLLAFPLETHTHARTHAHIRSHPGL